MKSFDFLRRESAPLGWSAAAPDLLSGKRFPPQWILSRPAKTSDLHELAQFQGIKTSNPWREAWYDELSVVGRDDPNYDTEKARFKRLNPRWKRVQMFFRR